MRKTDRSEQFDRPGYSKSLRIGLYEDCEFYRVPKESGKKGFRTISIYTGVLFHTAQNERQRRRYRLEISMLLIAAAIMFLWCCTNPMPYNSVIWINLPQGATLLCLVYMAVVWLIYLTAEQEMRAYLYRLTSLKLIRWGRVTGVIFAVDAVLMAIWSVWYFPENLFLHFAVTCGYAVSAACMLLLSSMERNLTYEERRSTEQPPENAEKLDW